MDQQHYSFEKLTSVPIQKSNRSTVTAHIPAYNCPDLLLRCVSHLLWVDELVIADNSSDDSVKAVVPLIDHPNVRYFRCEQPDIRIRLMDLIPETTTEYILWVCTDEFYCADAAKEILQILSGPEESRLDGYWVPWESYLFNQHYGEGKPDIRLFRKNKGYFEMKSMHDLIKVNGSLGKLKTGYDHFQCPTMTSQVGKIFFYAGNQARLVQSYDLESVRLDKRSGLQIKLHFLKETFRMLWRTRTIYFKKKPGFIQLMQQYEHMLNIIAADCAPTEEARQRELNEAHPIMESKISKQKKTLLSVSSTYTMTLILLNLQII